MEHKFLNFIGIIGVVVTIFAAHHYTKEKNMNAGIKTQNMDTSVRPGDDFYTYANGGWMRAHPLPDDYSRFGTWEELGNTSLARVREIAEQDSGKIGTLYRVAMDTDRRNTDGTGPVQPYLDEIDGLKTPADLPAYLAKMHRFSGAFFGDSVELDEMDSEHYLYRIVQSGIGMSRDYFFDTDAKSAEIRREYKKYIAAQLKNFGIHGDAEKIYALEERLARAFYPKEKLRDPAANYHKMSVADLKKDFPKFDWDAFLAGRGINPKNLNVAQPEAIAAAIAIMQETDMDVIKSYLKYRVANSAATFLDEKTYDLAFDFYNRKMAGQKTPKPKWKRAVALVDGTLGEMVGKLYVEKYFPAAAKKRMEALVENLRRAYAMRIEKLDWMSDETKEKALEKLHGFHAKIGYPNKWRDYGGLEINTDSLWQNMVRAYAFEDAYWLAKVDGDKDPTIWYMNAHEINAYYDPSTNEICFPAGILQYPFFDMDADDAYNYGAIGAIIGHEMTHGFDDEGRKFDVDGNMRDWWTDADAAGFDARAGVLERFFNNIMVTDEIHANGKFTLGENLADYGGVTIAYTAYKNFGTPSNESAGLTPDMRFFLAYAGAWAQNGRIDEYIRLTKIDPHSLPVNRVNGILPHIPAWYDAFGITEQDKLYVAPDQRIKLW